MTDGSDKPVEKKDPLKNLQTHTTENVLSRERNSIPGVLKQKRAINTIVRAVKDFYCGREETKDFLYDTYGYEASTCFDSEMERQKIDEIIPSLDHRTASRAKNTIDESLRATEDKINK